MDALKELVSRMGRGELARALNCSQSLVSHWVTGRKRVSAERARQIEDATFGTVKRHELRPDLFDAPPAANSTQSEAA